nr:hypothetical protein [Tanacetum cinerariifolium]
TFTCTFTAYKEYYAIATGAAPPKPKASVRKTRSSSDITITPPTVAAGPRLTTSAKGKQAAKADKAKSLSVLSEVAMTEAQQLKLVTKRSLQQTHISQASGSGVNEGTGDDDEGKDGDGNEEDEGDDGEEGDGDDDDKDDDGRDNEQEYDKEEYDEETMDEESFDPILKTPKNSDDEGNGHDEEEEEDELYRDVNNNQGRGIQATLKVKDSHVTLTPVNHDAQQQSSLVSSQFVTSMLNPTLDVGMESILETTSQMDVQTPTSIAPLPMSAPTMTPSTITTITITSQAPILPTTAPSTIIQDLPNFGSLFGFDNRLRTLEANFFEFMQTNQFAGAVSAILGIRNLYKALIEAYESDKIILNTYEDTVTLKRRRDDDADRDEEPFAGPDQGSKRRREGKEPESASTPTETATRSAGRSTQGSQSRQASASEPAFAEEPMQTTFQIEEPSHPEFDTAIHKSIQQWISDLAKQSDSRFSFNELMDTPLDFSNFLINRIKVDTLTLKLLAGPTYELMKGSCKSLVELEYHLEEVFKATTDQLDWVTPKREDLVPRKMWIQEPIGYDKHALWGVSHCGRKHQQFYGFAINRESARDVYSKRRIIAVTELKIVKWHNYKHLDWITVRRDDDKLYKFKEGDFKRLRIQDIEDILLLLVQGKLTNLTVEERFAFNVSLRMFTRSIVIQRRVEDLQLGVKSYQKKLNLTKPDTYRSDLKRKEAYIAYSNP